MSYRDEMLSAFDRLAQELQEQGNSYALGVRKARKSLGSRTTTWTPPYQVDLSAIDAVLSSRASLEGELIQVLADMAEAHGPTLVEDATDGPRLARALAVTTALPANTDRESLSHEVVDELAALLVEEDSSERPPTIQEVLGESYDLAKSVGAESTAALIVEITPLYMQEAHGRVKRRMEAAATRRKRSKLTFAHLLQWLMMLVTTVGALAAAAASIQDIVQEGSKFWLKLPGSPEEPT